MKWFFYFVVMANAMFFTWSAFVGDEPATPTEVVYAPPVSEKIRLLSEAPSQNEAVDNSSQNQGVAAALDNAVAGFKGSDTFCPRIEVEKKVEEQQIIKLLNDLGWRYSMQSTVGKRPKFWLYIDAPATKKDATEIVKALTAKSIDSFIITRKEMKNRISLGLYSSKGRAQQARQRIQADSGYTVNIYEHMRTVSLHQIDIKQEINSEDWDAFLSQFDLTKMMIKLEKNPC